MNIWQFFSIVLLAALVGVVSGPWAALNGVTRRCSFEVFVETMDHMSCNFSPALTVLLPTAFLSLLLAVLMSNREVPKLFYLNLAALVLFSGALFVMIMVELPIVEEIVTWASLAEPRDWRRTRSRWLKFHIIRIALSFASLILLLAAGGIQAFAVPQR